MIFLWKGYHSQELKRQLEQSWKQENLFILCPPQVNHFEFLKFLPEGPLELVGDFTSQERQEILKNREGALQCPLYPEKPVFGVFTSGTLSGKPRLVLYSKKNIVASLNGVRSFFEAQEIKTIFCYPQPAHSFGLVLGYLHAILHGLDLITPNGRYSKSSHGLWMECVNQSLHKKILTLGTPTHFYDLIHFVRENAGDPPSTISAIIGGAKVSVSLWQQIQTVLRIQFPSIGYGATEACPGIAHHPPGRLPLEEGEIGFPLPGVKISIHENLGIEFEGENVCLAILDDQGVSFQKSRIIPDLIEKRKTDGMLIFRGRKGLTLNRGGRKYSFEHIEELIHKELGLVCVAFGTADDRLGEDLGLVFAREDFQKNPDLKDRGDLREQCREILFRNEGTRFALTKFCQVDAIPRNENGKIDRVQISKMISAV